jgi:hypothetical protein
MMAGDQHALIYVSRILFGTVGTEQIKPSLPIKNAVLEDGVFASSA